MKKTKILIIEDDESIMMGLEQTLHHEGYDVLTASDGNEGLKIGLGNRPDLILLDVMLPGMSGYEVCRKLRDAGKRMPVIMLTARDEEFDKLHGFEMGADDYVTKPFSIKELIARIKVVLSRGSDRHDGPSEYRFGDCILDIEARVLKKKSAKTKKGSNEEQWDELTLTHTEFDLLEYFCANKGKALSRDQVMNDIWGTEYYGTQRSLDSFVASLRSKIEKRANKPELIITVHGVGYKFVG